MIPSLLRVSTGITTALLLSKDVEQRNVWLCIDRTESWRRKILPGPLKGWLNLWRHGAPAHVTRFFPDLLKVQLEANVHCSYNYFVVRTFILAAISGSTRLASLAALACTLTRHLFLCDLPLAQLRKDSSHFQPKFVCLSLKWRLFFHHHKLEVISPGTFSVDLSLIWLGRLVTCPLHRDVRCQLTHLMAVSKAASQDQPQWNSWTFYFVLKDWCAVISFHWEHHCDSVLDSLQAYKPYLVWSPWHPFLISMQRKS